MKDPSTHMSEALAKVQSENHGLNLRLAGNMSGRYVLRHERFSVALNNGKPCKPRGHSDAAKLIRVGVKALRADMQAEAERIAAALKPKK